MGRKNVLVSAYFAKNVGDDLFLKSLFDRYKNVNWYLLTANDEYKKVFKAYPHVDIIKTYREIGCINMFITLSAMTRQIKKYDAFVMIGGSMFIQNEQWEHLFLMRYKLIRLLYKYDVPSFIIGANFGPYKDERFKLKYNDYFKYYTGICFRDFYSYNLFNELPYVKVAPDAVLTLKTDRTMNKNRRAKNIVGLSPISLSKRRELQQYKEDYNSFLKKLIKHYIHKNYHLKLFSFCYEEGDLESIHNILQLLPHHYLEKITVVNYEGDLEVFLQKFQSCSKIIGTRLHSLILALTFKQSFLPLVYSSKTTDSLKKIGVKNRGFHIKDLATINLNSLEEKFNYENDESISFAAERQFMALDQVLTIQKPE